VNVRAARVRLASVVLLGLAAASNAADPQESWSPRSEDGLTWSERIMVPTESIRCGSPAVPCRVVTIEVRNDRHDGPLFCGGSVRFPQPNAHHMPETGWPQWVEVQAGAVGVVKTAHVPNDLPVASIYSRCKSTPQPLTPTAIQDVTDRVPPPPPPPPQFSAKGEPCKTQVLRVTNPDDYYPAQSIARGEQGAVIVRVFATETPGPPRDVMVDTSSGFAELDAAGLAALRDSRFSTNCMGHSQRLKVKFSLKKTAPATR
jgi:TonB family protein